MKFSAVARQRFQLLADKGEVLAGYCQVAGCH